MASEGLAGADLVALARGVSLLGGLGGVDGSVLNCVSSVGWC